jgi:hypothetical protein
VATKICQLTLNISTIYGSWNHLLVMKFSPEMQTKWAENPQDIHLGRSHFGESKLQCSPLILIARACNVFCCNTLYWGL